MEMISRELIEILRKHFTLDWHGVHGASHWARVRENGLRLASLNGANVHVVELFAFIHDSCRVNEWHDPEHGVRAGVFAHKLAKSSVISLHPNELELLVYACNGHSLGYNHPEITISTCWDADRLDLGRVGNKPDPVKLCTAAAKLPEMIEWAYSRSIKNDLSVQQYFQYKLSAYVGQQ